MVPVFLREFFEKMILRKNSSTKSIMTRNNPACKAVNRYATWGEFNNARARRALVEWYLSLFVMCKAWHQYNERLKALALLNSSQVYLRLFVGYRTCAILFVRHAISLCCIGQLYTIRYLLSDILGMFQKGLHVLWVTQEASHFIWVLVKHVKGYASYSKVLAFSFGNMLHFWSEPLADHLMGRLAWAYPSQYVLLTPNMLDIFMFYSPSF